MAVCTSGRLVVLLPRVHGTAPCQVPCVSASGGRNRRQGHQPSNNFIILHHCLILAQCVSGHFRGSRLPRGAEMRRSAPASAEGSMVPARYRPESGVAAPVQNSAPVFAARVQQAAGRVRGRLRAVLRAAGQIDRLHLFRRPRSPPRLAGPKARSARPPARSISCRRAGDRQRKAYPADPAAGRRAGAWRTWRFRLRQQPQSLLTRPTPVYSPGALAEEGRHPG